MMTRGLFGLLFAMATFGLADSALGYGAYGGWVWGAGWYGSGYVAESPPYFALHPPVYYSRPIARPYGWSPFPWPPGWELSAREVRTGSPPAAAAPVRPLRIRNPFVEQSGGEAAAAGSQVHNSVQTVYPASMGASSR